LLKKLVSRRRKGGVAELAPWIVAPRFGADQPWGSGNMTKLKDLEKKVEVLSQLLDMEVHRLEKIAGIDELDKQFKEWDEQVISGKPAPSARPKGKLKPRCVEQEVEC
jgi:hypothetical protein